MGRLIDADKFLTYLIFSKHIDGLTCGEVKEAVEMCKVDILELEALQDGIITRKKLRDLYDEFDRKTWSESENVRDDNMIEIGTARQILCDLFCELGVWDEGEEPEI
jgi:hypothetical protein